MIPVDVVLLARVGQNAIRRRPSLESPDNGERFCEKDRIVVCDRVLYGVVVNFFETLRQVKLVAVLMSRGIEPASFIDSDGVDHERIPLPFRDRMSKKLGTVIAKVFGM